MAVGIPYTLNAFGSPELFFIFASILACLVAILHVEDRVLLLILLCALGVRLGLALVQAYTGIDLPGAGDDSVTFENEGWKNAQAWLHGGEGGRSTGAYYFSSWIGLLYIFFGRVPLVPQLFNVYFSLLSIYLIYRTAKVFTGSLKVCRIAALLLLIFPTLNSYSAILMRESLLVFFGALSLYFLVLWMYQGRLIYLAYSFIAVAFNGALHGVMFLLIFVHLLFLCFYSPVEKKFRLVLWQLLPAGILVVIASLLLGNLVTYQLPGNIADIFTPDFIRNVLERKPLARTSYLLDYVPYTYFDLIWQTPLRVIYFLFAPFPWMIGGLRDLLGFLEVINYGILFVLFFIGTIKVWPKNKQVVIACFLFAAALIVMFSWGTTNYGTAWRHKQKILPYIVVISAPGLAASTKRLDFLEDDEKLL